MANFKCRLCNKSFVSLESLYTHLEKYHSNEIPKDMSVPQYYYFLKTGRKNGNCVMCKHPTTWNKNTNKYNRFCDNPACKQKYADEFKKRMIGKYGKVHLLNDPQKQREMLAARSISGSYRWDDGTEMTYTGSYELDFIHLLADFFDWDPQDISAPSPHTYTYNYEGEDKFYIPDFFIHSLDLEIEVKDGGDNPNMHHKIQDVDKVKEKLKDDVLKSQKTYHYVKITNKNYTNFFNFLMKIKEEFNKYGDESKIPRIFMCEDIRTKAAPEKAKLVYEATELPFEKQNDVIEEEIHVDPEHMKIVLEFAEQLECAEIITESFVSELEKQINNFLKLTVSDMEKSVRFTFDSKKGNHEDVEAYLKNLIKVSKSEKDMFLIKSLAQDYVRHCEKQSRVNPEAIENERVYKQWMVSDYRKAYDKKWKKIHESFEYLSTPKNDIDTIMYEGIDNALVWLDKPLKKLTRQDIRLYHGSIDDIKDKYLTPSGVNVGATKYSTPRWSTYYWDNYDDAVCWGMTWALQKAGVKVLYRGARGKTMVAIDEYDNEKDFMKKFVDGSIFSFVYEVEVPISKLEIGSVPSIKEYTLSEKTLIDKKTKIRLTPSVFKQFFEFTPLDEMIALRNSIKIENMIGVRNKILNNVLDNYRDPYRVLVKREVKRGTYNVGDDISRFKNVINNAVKNDIMRLKESYYEDILEEGSISISTMNNILAADDRKRLDAYIDAYETYYKQMEKERPEKIKNINQDIKQALKIIDDMAKSGKVSNDLAKYAKNRLDHQGIWIDPRKNNVVKEEYGIGNMSVVIGASQQTRAFGLNDTESKVFIDDDHYFSRPDGLDSAHCSLKKGSVEKYKNGKRVLTYNIKPHDNVDMNDIIKKYISEALTLPGLFKLSEATSGKFIKDICNRMGIECDVELIDDKVY